MNLDAIDIQAFLITKRKIIQTIMCSPMPARNTNDSNPHTKKPKQCSYTKLLGLSQGQGGRPAYRGILKEFKSATSELVDELVGEFMWKEDIQSLKNEQEIFYHRGIEECLAQYGPKIWNDGVSSPYTTSPDDNVHLVYDNKEDQTK